MKKNYLLVLAILSAGCIIAAFFYFSYLFTSRKEDPSASNSRQSNKTLQEVTLVTDWYAQAEHGGYYQALAENLYEKNGLSVAIKMGNPDVNCVTLLVSNAADFCLMSAYTLFKAIDQGIPIFAVGAIFQKDITVLLGHPETHGKTLQQLNDRPIIISYSTATAVWPFLEKKARFQEKMRKNYVHNLSYFLSDKSALQEALMSSEPYLVEKEGGFKPVIFKLSDIGYNPYSQIIVTSRDLEKNHPAVIQKFLSATFQGWADYLQNPELGNKVIKKENPQMSDELLSYAHNVLVSEEVVAAKNALGDIGKMTDERWGDFFQEMVSINAIDKNFAWKEAYSLKYLSSK